MRPSTGGSPRCERCGYELEGSEEGCPGCGFNPRQTGIRVSLGFLLVVVCSMTVLSIPVLAGLAPILLAVAAVSFGLAVATFVLSVLATPARIGAVLARLRG
ncbi:hypothetical protein [Natronococcus occultus]|uniref:Uncharacterized protein n=1 Tax=Natronococcus occultus SP4 TaxID=694430 RepID=L0JY62_9EURY|nr:hypothetical protein [Natronococcus occultus]AGB37240.1 hypothetical protein Natoc_1429 [Natronococcus occultus SP4]